MKGAVALAVAVLAGAVLLGGVCFEIGYTRGAAAVEPPSLYLTPTVAIPREEPVVDEWCVRERERQRRAAVESLVEQGLIPMSK